MKNLFTFLASIFVLASCTGGNESVTGAVWTDYIPSAIMIAGTALGLYGGVRVASGTPNGKVALVWGLILLAAGAAYYFLA